MIIPILFSVFSFLTLNRFFYLNIILLHLVVFTLWRNRNSPKFFKDRPGGYLSPIDGVIVDIKTEIDCPYVEGSWKCVSIKNRITDPFMQYAPISGSVVQVKFLEVNEDFSWLLFMGDQFFEFFHKILNKLVCRSVLVTEINDLIEKTHCIIETSAFYSFKYINSLKTIKYSGPINKSLPIGTSNKVYGDMLTNVYIPLNCQIEVQITQTVIAGETFIATQIDSTLLSFENIKIESKQENDNNNIISIGERSAQL